MPQSPSFSQRYGYKPIRDTFQIDSMDEALKNKLWNVLLRTIINIADYRFYDELFGDFYSKPLLKIHNQFSMHGYDYFKESNEFREKYFESDWLGIYELFEFILNSNYLKQVQFNYDLFVKSCNEVLEREMSAYRIINNRIVRITDETEINSIEESVKLTEQNNKFFGAKTHLETAIKLFSERENCDYRNTIKESISAVENVCRVLTGENTLGKALDCLEKKNIKINSQLKKSFENLYHYTNDKTTGIRHTLIAPDYIPTFEEAKYMLVSCTAFINYLIGTSK